MPLIHFMNRQTVDRQQKKSQHKVSQEQSNLWKKCEEEEEEDFLYFPCLCFYWHLSFFPETLLKTLDFNEISQITWQ